MHFLNLASNRSYSRGIDYYHDKRVLECQNIDDYKYKSLVKGENDNIYQLEINVKHPKKSKCNCKFAYGRYVICKHMVASYLTIFPNKEKEIEEFAEEQNKIYEMKLQEDYEKEE